MNWLALVGSSLLLLGTGCRCGSKSSVDSGAAPVSLTPKKGGVLTVRLALEPNGLTRLHDRFAEGTMTRITVGPIYETVAQVCSGWKEAEDHGSVTLSLRPGRHFHDGSSLTAADVKATLDVILDTALPTSTLRSSLDTIDSVTVLDELTVKVAWKSRSFLALHTLLDAVPVMPAEALKGGEFDTLPIHRAPIGSGPFKFEKWEPGVSLTYVRADDRAWVDRLVFRFIKDETAALQAFEKGDVDLLTRVSASGFRATEQSPSLRDVQRLVVPENAYAWIGFNQRHALFADPRVRTALAKLYPAEIVEKTVDLGLEPRTTCPYFDPSPSCDPDVRPIAADLEGAKQALASAGFADHDGDGVLDREGVRFSFSFLIASQSVKMTKLVPLYLDLLKAAQIDAHIETVDVSAYMARVRTHDFDAMALSWSSPDATQDLFAAFHSSQADAGNNYLGYRNAEVDALLERIRSELNDDARHALERRAHRLLYDDQAYLFLGRRPSLDLASARVHGLRPTLAGYDYSAVWVSP